MHITIYTKNYETVFEWALDDNTQVVLSEGFGQLDDSFSKSFIQKAAKQGVFKT